ncbi:MAG: hypothetical protein CFE23_16260 [Flavobacterium sp. BFFFF1]|uniref:DUF2911 domain-containing protein n=1 Tax=unclassified Flavobacterium TaxID=196869 RepID=UPI000BD2742F|nr:MULTISPECIES: DUF2911 domain-containing protein [unclassified Flavobacterium]OYU78966.1 MAG: hypothetical protein CFE23_16260 [Flavobacterium sp. BFFFF1]
MKQRVTLSILFMIFGISSAVLAQEKPLSTAETATGTINGSSITINYGSPSVRAREIWGKLVPFDEVWRAGANEATTFTTDKDIMVEGSKLPAGTYSFFVIPNAKESTLIFNKVVKQWGAYKYDQAQDQLRVKVKPRATSASTEKLTYNVNKDNITLSWEKWELSFKVK